LWRPQEENCPTADKVKAIYAADICPREVGYYQLIDEYRAGWREREAPSRLN
jgi:hypothetical protein